MKPRKNSFGQFPLLLEPNISQRNGSGRCFAGCRHLRNTTHKQQDHGRERNCRHVWCPVKQSALYPVVSINRPVLSSYLSYRELSAYISLPDRFRFSSPLISFPYLISLPLVYFFIFTPLPPPESFLYFFFPFSTDTVLFLPFSSIPATFLPLALV